MIGWLMNVEQLVEWTLAGEPKYSERTHPQSHLSTTDPIRAELGLKSGLRGEELVTNHLSYGTAVKIEILHC
jgi:hypothetical protein